MKAAQQAAASAPAMKAMQAMKAMKAMKSTPKAAAPALATQEMKPMKFAAFVGAGRLKRYVPTPVEPDQPMKAMNVISGLGLNKFKQILGDEHKLFDFKRLNHFCF